MEQSSIIRSYTNLRALKSLVIEGAQEKDNKVLKSSHRGVGHRRPMILKREKSDFLFKGWTMKSLFKAKMLWKRTFIF